MRNLLAGLLAGTVVTSLIAAPPSVRDGGARNDVRNAAPIADATDDPGLGKPKETPGSSEDNDTDSTDEDDGPGGS